MRIRNDPAAFFIDQKTGAAARAAGVLVQTYSRQDIDFNGIMLIVVEK